MSDFSRQTDSSKGYWRDLKETVGIEQDSARHREKWWLSDANNSVGEMCEF